MYLNEQTAQCQKCVEGCFECSAIDECRQCDEDSDYFLYKGKCEECFLPGCSNCSLTTCSECNETANYVL